MATGGSRLAQEFECPLCLSEFDRPKVMGQCLHSACFKCVEKLVWLARGNRFSCPVCTRICIIPYGGVSELRDDFKLRSIVEQYKLEAAERNMRKMPTDCSACKEPAIHFCEDCGGIYLCDSCQDKHSEGVGQDHLLSPLNHVCKEHGKALSYFCFQCNHELCVICSFSGHHGHNVSLITDMFAILTAKLPQVVDKISELVSKLTLAEERFSYELDLAIPENERKELSISTAKYDKLEFEKSSEIRALTEKITALKLQLRPLKREKAKARLKLEGILVEKQDIIDEIQEKYDELRAMRKSKRDDARKDRISMSQDLKTAQNFLGMTDNHEKRRSLAAALGLAGHAGERHYKSIVAKWGKVFTWIKKQRPEEESNDVDSSGV